MRGESNQIKPNQTCGGKNGRWNAGGSNPVKLGLREFGRKHDNPERDAYDKIHLVGAGGVFLKRTVP
jgi:hypothetical protein